MARPLSGPKKIIEFSQKDLDIIAGCARVGCTLEEIASILGINYQSIQRHLALHL